jgi:succinate dehydrogenase/fumarate reductase cytochrome b subunit
MAKNGRDLLKRFNRVLAWLTLIVFVVFVFAGYGMTNPAVTSALSGGVFNKVNSSYIHIHLAAPILILLMVHVLIGLRNALVRWGVKEELLLNLFLVVLGVFVAGVIIVLQYFVL